MEELSEQLWTQINEIEKLNCKMNSCRSIIAICAERLLGDESGALWAVSDMLQSIENEMDVRASILMQISKQLDKPVKKAKK